MITSRFTWITAAFVSALLAAACSSEHSGVDTAKQVSALGTDDTSTFCDWAIDKYGGESSAASCGDAGAAPTGPTKQSCADDLAAKKSKGCAATVAQLEDCVKAEVADRCGARPNACASIDACK